MAVELASGHGVTVLSAEDLLVYRLHEFVATGHSDPLGQALMLLDFPELDRQRLEARVESERLLPALHEVERLAGRVKEGEHFETWELHDIARRLQ